MKLIIIAGFLFSYAFSLLLKYLNFRHRNAPLPENVRDVYDADTYARNQAYQMENLKVSIISDLIGFLLTLTILICNFHFFLSDYISQYTDSIYWASLFMFFVASIITGIVSIFASIYSTFVIEEKYGFNKTTIKTFIFDQIKSFLLSYTLTLGLLALVIWLYEKYGNGLFIIFFFFMCVFMLFMRFISPFLIRIFNKLTPLTDGELKTKIEELAKKTGYKLKGIYMVDASKRSTKLNAFATGFGKTKTIGLYDTLVEKMTDDEIVAILAHEIGHAKKQHILKSMPFGLINFALMLFLAYYLVTIPAISTAFGFSESNLVFGIIAFFYLMSPVMILLSIPANIISRKHEFEADAFERELTNSDVAISALKKLYREDLGNLTPHPFVVLIEYSHPTLSQRVAALEDKS